MNKMVYLYLAALIYFVREFSTVEFKFNNQYLNPAQLFITSFFLIILAGTALLMLPKATYEGISLLRRTIYFNQCSMCYRIDRGGYRLLFYPFWPDHYFNADADWWFGDHDLCQLFQLFFQGANLLSKSIDAERRY